MCDDATGAGYAVHEAENIGDAGQQSQQGTAPGYIANTSS